MKTESVAASEAPDLREYLQQELLRRCKVNPKYSLRAFALALQIEAAELSKMLNGKRGISQKKFLHLAQRLNLSPQQMERFQKNTTSAGDVSTAQEKALPNYQQLTLDAFQAIADWQHYALLELTTVENFEPDARWISKTLGISVAEVKDSAERLVRLGFLEITPEGRWVDCSGDVTTVGNEFSAQAFRRLQRAVLEKALTALQELPFETRDQSSMTMAIDSSLLPEAKKKILKFRRSLCAFLQNGKKRDQVYHLGVSLYPVTRITAKESKK